MAMTGFVDAYDSGARGDDSTDNTAILQGILDDFRDGSGGTLFIPSGPQGRIYQTKQLWVASNTRIVSNGAQLKYIGTSAARTSQSNGDPVNPAAANAVLMISPQERVSSDTGDQFNIAIEHLELFCNTLGNFGLSLLGCYQVEIRDVHVFGTPQIDCLYISHQSPSATTNRWVVVDHCRLEGASRNGISITRGEEITIENCAIYSATGNPGDGIDVEPNYYQEHVLALRFVGNRITSCAGPGIEFSNPIGSLYAEVDSDHVVAENVISGNSTSRGIGGIAFGGGQDNGAGGVRIVNNAVFNNSGAGPVTGSTRNSLVIVGNDFRGRTPPVTSQNTLVMQANYT